MFTLLQVMTTHASVLYKVKWWQKQCLSLHQTMSGIESNTDSVAW